MKGARGIFGTGIWPFRISSAPAGWHYSIHYGDKLVSGMCRDYVAVLFIPLIPLGLSAMLFPDERISLNRENRRQLMSAMRSWYGTRFAKREAALVGLRASWPLAFLVAAAGAVAGYFAASLLPSLPAFVGSLVGCALTNGLYLFAIRPRWT